MKSALGGKRPPKLPFKPTEEPLTLIALAVVYVLLPTSPYANSIPPA